MGTSLRRRFTEAGGRGRFLWVRASRHRWSGLSGRPLLSTLT